MDIVIIDDEGRIASRQSVRANGDESDFFNLAWEAAVEDGDVEADERYKYTIRRA